MATEASPGGGGGELQRMLVFERGAVSIGCPGVERRWGVEERGRVRVSSPVYLNKLQYRGGKNV